MGSVGDCYDNAVAESFFATLKKDLVNRASWPTKAELRSAVFAYVEGFYAPFGFTRRSATSRRPSSRSARSRPPEGGFRPDRSPAATTPRAADCLSAARSTRAAPHRRRIRPIPDDAAPRSSPVWPREGRTARRAPTGHGRWATARLRSPLKDQRWPWSRGHSKTANLSICVLEPVGAVGRLALGETNSMMHSGQPFRPSPAAGRAPRPY